MFTREKLLQLPELNQIQLEQAETLMQKTPIPNDELLQWILKQRAEATILIAFLNTDFKKLCYDNSLDLYWKTYIESIPWEYNGKGNEYHMQFRTDLPAFDQAIALYCFDQSTSPQNNELTQRPWRMLSIQYGSYSAAMKQIGIYEIELSKSQIENPDELIHNAKLIAIRMAMLHLTPGFILLGYTYMMIGNYYHELAKTAPHFAALKIAYYKIILVFRRYNLVGLPRSLAFAIFLAHLLMDVLSEGQAYQE